MRTTACPAPIVSMKVIALMAGARTSMINMLASGKLSPSMPTFDMSSTRVSASGFLKSSTLCRRPDIEILPVISNQGMLCKVRT